MLYWPVVMWCSTVEHGELIYVPPNLTTLLLSPEPMPTYELALREGMRLIPLSARNAGYDTLPHYMVTIVASETRPNAKPGTTKMKSTVKRIHLNQQED